MARSPAPNLSLPPVASLLLLLLFMVSAVLIIREVGRSALGLSQTHWYQRSIAPRSDADYSRELSEPRFAPVRQPTP